MRALKRVTTLLPRGGALEPAREPRRSRAARDRAHRYKNHAVRKNVARVYGRPVLDSADPAPGSAMFDAAYLDRPADANDLVPFWVFSPPGGVVIERYVPALPLSLETARYHR